MDINAFITRIDRKFAPSGPLEQLRIGIKDMYDTAGFRTTAASAEFKDRIPQNDADAVANLKAAGAYIVGKTNMHRLGMGTTSLVSDFGPVRNPRNADFVAGGSSGGSAAAVAAGLCDATLDTDAVGSCRLPAACCGVVGFKGAYALINNRGVFGGDDEPSDTILALAHAAVTARSVSGVKTMVEILASANLGESQASPRVGIMRHLPIAKPLVPAFEAAIATLRNLGYTVADVTPDLDRNYFDIRTIAADRANVEQTIFGDVDVLVSLTMIAPVPTIAEAGSDENAVSPHNTIFANYFGLPAISVPCGIDHRGLPVGLQIVGRPHDDATVLSVAARYEAAR